MNIRVSCLHFHCNYFLAFNLLYYYMLGVKECTVTLGTICYKLDHKLICFCALYAHECKYKTVQVRTRMKVLSE